jgi:hypothetical protein
MRTDTSPRENEMTTHFRSASHLIGYTLAVVVTAGIVVAGSVWATGIGQQTSVAPESVGIEVAALLSSAEIANLPVLHVEHPF